MIMTYCKQIREHANIPRQYWHEHDKKLIQNLKKPKALEGSVMCNISLPIQDLIQFFFVPSLLPYNYRKEVKKWDKNE